MARTMADKQAAAERIAERLANRDPADTQWQDGTSLRCVAEAFGRSVTDEMELADAIAAARQDGCSWGAIADVLGLSKQTVQQRYGANAANS